MTARAPRPSLLVDGRWRGYTGVGRVTDLFLRGLGGVDVGREIRVWTRANDRVGADGFETIATGHPPLQVLGQRDLTILPPADHHLWLHAVRPLTSKATAVVVHDLIPVTRYPPAQRVLWKQFFRRSVASADRVLVYSDATRERVEAILDVPPHRIGRFDLTIDTTLADRVRDAREGLRGRDDPSSGHLLYVGQFKDHKNLDRALEAFARTAGASAGRSFVLVGGRGEECEHVRRHADAVGARTVRVIERCSDDDLVSLYAGAAAVIQPSLEEGFGLTVLEALVAGIPVACSSIPTHVEASRGQAAFFDPLDVEAMTAAIDAALDAPPPQRPDVLTLPDFALGLLRAAELAPDDR